MVVPVPELTVKGQKSKDLDACLRQAILGLSSTEEAIFSIPTKSKTQSKNTLSMLTTLTPSKLAEATDGSSSASLKSQPWDFWQSSSDKNPPLIPPRRECWTPESKIKHRKSHGFGMPRWPSAAWSRLRSNSEAEGKTVIKDSWISKQRTTMVFLAGFFTGCVVTIVTFIIVIGVASSGIKDFDTEEVAEAYIAPNGVPWIAIGRNKSIETKPVAQSVTDSPDLRMGNTHSTGTPESEHENHIVTTPNPRNETIGSLDARDKYSKDLGKNESQNGIMPENPVTSGTPTPTLANTTPISGQTGQNQYSTVGTPALSGVPTKGNSKTSMETTTATTVEPSFGTSHAATEGSVSQNPKTINADTEPATAAMPDRTYTESSTPGKTVISAVTRSSESITDAVTETIPFMTITTTEITIGSTSDEAKNDYTEQSGTTESSREFESQMRPANNRTTNITVSATEAILPKSTTMVSETTSTTPALTSTPQTGITSESPERNKTTNTPWNTSATTEPRPALTNPTQAAWTGDAYVRPRITPPPTTTSTKSVNSGSTQAAPAARGGGGRRRSSRNVNDGSSNQNVVGDRDADDEKMPVTTTLRPQTTNNSGKTRPKRKSWWNRFLHAVRQTLEKLNPF